MIFNNKNLSFKIPKVMGILNVTPDSFSDGGAFKQLDAALRQTEQMLSQGASFIDVGGESTRPGAQDVSEQEELDRVIPIIEAIHTRFDTIISVDTSKAQVMTQAVNAGASLINDVRALREPNALAAAVAANVPVCLMHMTGQPRSMQLAPDYNDVVKQVCDFLLKHIARCTDAGIPKTKIMIDPGFGFGKSLVHNYQLLNKLEDLHSLNLPILVGMSRKSMLGTALLRDVDDRLAGSIAVATIAALKGVQIIRVHDVKETIDAIKVVAMLPKDNNNNE
ncbi:MAG: dihydropteroate synthase [Paraglaciecola sp.]|jgi:dihydropteroate synthase